MKTEVREKRKSSKKDWYEKWKELETEMKRKETKVKKRREEARRE